jgi:integrase
MNGDGFVFSLDGGATPVCRKTMYQDFHRALRNIGISDDEISERHLHLHGWRHFFNTELLKGGLTIPQTQAVTRHKSERMTEWYLHFDPNEFAQARKVQENLLKPEVEKPAAKGKQGKAGKPGRTANGKIIPMPEQGKTPAQKGA